MDYKSFIGKSINDVSSEIKDRNYKTKYKFSMYKKKDVILNIKEENDCIIIEVSRFRILYFIIAFLCILLLAFIIIFAYYKNNVSNDVDNDSNKIVDEQEPVNKIEDIQNDNNEETLNNEEEKNNISSDIEDNKNTIVNKNDTNKSDKNSISESNKKPSSSSQNNSPVKKPSTNTSSNTSNTNNTSTNKNNNTNTNNTNTGTNTNNNTPSKNPEVVEIKYVCPDSSYTLSGTKCSKKVTVNAIPTGECPEVIEFGAGRFQGHYDSNTKSCYYKPYEEAVCSNYLINGVCYKDKGGYILLTCPESGYNIDHASRVCYKTVEIDATKVEIRK